MFVMRLTPEERATLVKLLTSKVKEIHAWRIATGSALRDKDYEETASLLGKIVFKKGG